MRSVRFRRHLPIILLAFLFSNLSTPAHAKVSKSQFMDALNQVRVFQDEFEGNYEIYGPVSADDWTYDENDNAFEIQAHIDKINSRAKWRFGLVPFYWGEDWIFLNQVSIKSSKGTLNLRAIDVFRDVDDGKVSETGSVNMTNSQMLKFCQLIKGNDVIFRIRGTKGDVTGEMTDGSIGKSLAVCTVYQGLLQGFKPN